MNNIINTSACKHSPIGDIVNINTITMNIIIKSRSIKGYMKTSNYIINDKDFVL